MKKLLLSLLLVLFLAANVFAFDFYSYIGKNVKVCLISHCYTGKVIDIVPMDICKQTDPISHGCLHFERYYTMFLQGKEKVIHVIRCETINSIQEIK